MTVAHYLDGADPIRRQLLGESPNGGFGYTSPAEEDVPLKTLAHRTARRRGGGPLIRPVAGLP